MSLFGLATVLPRFVRTARGSFCFPSKMVLGLIMSVSITRARSLLLKSKNIYHQSGRFGCRCCSFFRAPLYSGY